MKISSEEGSITASYENDGKHLNEKRFSYTREPIKKFSFSSFYIIFICYTLNDDSNGECLWT